MAAFDIAELNGRRTRRRNRRRALGSLAVVAVVAVAVISVTELTDGGPSVDFAPADQSGGGAVLPGQEVPLPEQGQIEMAWLEARDELPVPVFVVHDPAGDVHAVHATTAYLADVEASVGWCEEGSVLLSWRLGAIFAPDGSYIGGPPARGLDTFDTELTDGGTVRIGARREGLSRGASQAHADEQQQRWGRRDHDACFAARLPLAALTLHGVPDGDVLDRAIAPSEVALDGPKQPEGWVLLDGTLVVGEAPGQPPLLCDELVSTDPPACPDDAPRVRMQPLREDAGTWAYTGLFRAAVQGSQLGRLTLVTADVSHVTDSEQETLALDPPLQYPDGTIEDDIVTVAAADIHYGPPPSPFPAGTYELRLDNSGHLPHTLVNDELDISLRAEGASRASAQVQLPAGQHTFICEIPGHTSSMQITLTVD